MARYNSDGTLDSTFGGDGMIMTNFTPFDDQVGAGGLALQPDGKIVAAGFTGYRDGSRVGSPKARFGLARYNADGTLDTAFGGDGKVTTDVAPNGDWGYAVAIQGDGKIVGSRRG